MTGFYRGRTSAHIFTEGGTLKLTLDGQLSFDPDQKFENYFPGGTASLRKLLQTGGTVTFGITSSSTVRKQHARASTWAC